MIEINNMDTNNPGYVQPNNQTQKFEKGKISLLTQSMLIGGIGFILIGVFAFLISLGFRNLGPDKVNMIWIWVFLGGLIVSMVISMLWTKVFWEGKSIGATIAIFVLYIGFMSLAFGCLFSELSYLRDGLNLIFLAFIITGAIFLLTCLFARLLTLRGVVTLSKIIGATSIAMSITLLASLIAFMVLAFTRAEGAFWAFDTITCLVLVGMSIITFLYIIIDLWRIMGMSQFMDSVGEKPSSAMVWYTGFRLLSDLINVLWLVVIILLRYGRRR